MKIFLLFFINRSRFLTFFTQKCKNFIFRWRVRNNRFLRNFCYKKYFSVVLTRIHDIMHVRAAIWAKFEKLTSMIKKWGYIKMLKLTFVGKFSAPGRVAGKKFCEKKLMIVIYMWYENLFHI